MEWKKADALEWAGDSFNRDSTVCSYVITDNIKQCYNTLATCESSLGSVTIRDDFNTLSDSVTQLAASLQELKDAFEKMNKESMPRASKLRSALKTLNCKYEVM